jgi:hypothetical protein
MEVIVINRPLQKNEEQTLLEQLNSGIKEFALYANFPLSEELAGFSKGPIELLPDEKKAINYEIFNHVLNFGEIKIGDIAITDLLMFEKASIWHYHKFRTYFFIRNLIFEIRLIEKLSLEYQKITYYGESAFLKNYPFYFPELALHIPNVNKSKINYRTIFNYILFFKLRVIAGLFQLMRFRKVQHIVIDHAIKQTLLNLNTLKPEPGNYNLEYLFEKLDQDFLILDDVDIPKFHKGSDFKLKKWHFFPKGRRLFGEVILLKGLFSVTVRRQIKSFDAQLKGKFELIRSSLTNPIDLIIIDFIESLHASSKLFLFKYLAYKKFFSRHPYKSISTIDENSPRIKSILDAAKSNGIKTIGIQHGTIHELNPAFVYTKEDAYRKVIPDLMLIWGESWKKFLTKIGNYDPETLFITGQIRTDIIHRLQKHKSNIPTSIPSNSSIILFASQPQHDAKIRERSALDVFSSVNDIPNVHLLLKLHPAEFNDFNYYHDLARLTGCTNYQIVLQEDLYYLISIADIVITCFSTVGAEAVYFDKPLIILDHLKQDLQKYYTEGIAFQATNQSELSSYIGRILYNELRLNTSCYERYIQNNAYRVDGKVSERCINFIKSL